MNTSPAKAINRFIAIYPFSKPLKQHTVMISIYTFKTKLKNSIANAIQPNPTLNPRQKIKAFHLKKR